MSIFKKLFAIELQDGPATILVRLERIEAVSRTEPEPGTALLKIYLESGAVLDAKMTPAELKQFERALWSVNGGLAK